MTRSERSGITYLVCANPRVGSTLFCDALASTKCAGHPREYFNPDLFGELSILTESTGGQKFLERVLSLAQTENGVSGIKLMWTDLQFFFDTLRSGEDDGVNSSDIELFIGAFAGAKAVHLTRRNKVRTAISYWLARTTDAWACSDSSGQPRVSVPDPDWRMITELHALSHASDMFWREFLLLCNIDRYELVYEDWTADLDGAIGAVCAEFLGIPGFPSLKIQTDLLRQAGPQTDRIESEWIERVGHCSECSALRRTERASGSAKFFDDDL